MISREKSGATRSIALQPAWGPFGAGCALDSRKLLVRPRVRTRATASVELGFGTPHGGCGAMLRVAPDPASNRKKLSGLRNNPRESNRVLVNRHELRLLHHTPRIPRERSI